MSFKRILALILALTLCMSIAIPSGVAFAEKPGDDEIVIGGADPFNTPGTGPEIPTGNTCEHEWVATWSVEPEVEDFFYYYADVTFTCSKCDASQTFTRLPCGMVEEKDASCTEGGYQYVTVSKEFNGQTYSKTYNLSEPTEPDPENHVFTEHVEAKAATCTEDGNCEYYRCVECGKYFSDELCETEIPADQIVIPATTDVHNYENGVCTVCGTYEWPQAGLTGPFAYNTQVNVRPFDQILSSNPDIYGQVTPSVAYTFSIYGDEAHNRITDFGDWKCDYVVSISGGVDAYSFGLFGNYGEFGDIAFFTPQNIGANDEIPLLLSVATNAWTYEMVYNFVQSFTCGAFNTFADNVGKTFTVKLVLWDPEYGSDYFAAKAANAVHVVQEIEYVIGTTSPLYIDGTPYTYKASGTDPEGFTLDEYGNPVACADIEDFNGPHYAPIREPQIKVNIVDNNAVVADIDAGIFTEDAKDPIEIPAPDALHGLAVTFDAAAVAAIATNAGDSALTLKVEDVTEDEGPVTFEITMVKVVDGQERGPVFSEDNAAGTATVSVPFAATGNAPVVVYLVVGQTKTAVPCSYANGVVTFTVEHFSTYTVEQQADSVAKIETAGGTRYYSSLADAINDAAAGETVTLLTDTTLNTGSSSTSRFPISKSMTIDGDGHTITIDKRGFGVGLNASGNVDVTFKDVTILNSSNGARCIDTRGNLNSLTLDNVTLSTKGCSSGYDQPLTIGGNQSSTATVIIRNGSVIKTSEDGTAYYAIITFNPVNMTIDHSTLKGWACIYAKGPDGSAGSAGSTFTITNSTLVSKNAYSGESNAFSMFMVEDDNVTINVTNTEMSVSATGDQHQAISSFQANDSITGASVNLGAGNEITLNGDNAVFSDNGAPVLVSGGTFNIEVPEENCAPGYIPESWVDPDTGETVYGVKVGTYVAQIGDVKYESLADAINNAAAGDTVTLLTDTTLNTGSSSTSRFPISKSMTIDGGGNTITINNRGFGVGMNASGNVDVTFKDVTILNSSNGARCIDTRGNLNSLTLDNVTLSTKGCSSGYDQPLTIGGNQSSTATVIIRNGSVIKTSEDGTAYYAITTFNPVDMTIDQSTIKGWACIYAKGPDGSAGSAGSTFTITNSTLVSKNVYTGETNDFCMLMAEDDDVTFNVTNSSLDVTSTGESQAIGGTSASQTGVEINLGTGNTVAMNGQAVFAANSADVEVSGGTFNIEVPEENCAPGFAPKANGDGTYGVEKVKAFEAYDANGDLIGAYTTLNDAIEEGGNGCTVKLVADVYEQQQINSQMTPVTFDLNGHWIDVDGGAGLNFSMGYYWNGDHVFTVKDSVGTGGINITPKYTGNACISDNTGRTIIVESGTFTSTGKAVYCTASNATMTINGGTFNGDIYVHDTGYGHGDLSITDGTVNGTLSTVGDAVIAVSGGTFSEPVPEEYCATGYIPKDNGDGTYGVKVGSYVAQIGDVKYEGLFYAANAVAASETPVTIVLLKDIEVTGSSTAVQGLFYVANGKNIVLDMDGHSITYTISNRWSSSPYISSDIYVQAGGSLTITGDGTMINSGSSTAAIIRNNGTLVIEDGSFSVTNATSGFMQILDNQGDATINDGTFTGLTRTQTISNGAGSGSPTLTINGGTISSALKDAIDNHGHVTVNGGTIQGGASTGTPPAHAINTHGRSAEPEAVTTTITGGTILAGTGGVSENDSCFSASSGITVVSGGTFNQSVEVYDGNGHVTIQGAEINPETNVYQVVPAYTVTFNSNGGSDVDPIKVPKNGTTAERTITTAPVPTKDEYCFSAWLDGSTVVAFPYEVTADVTLTAQWVDAVAAVYNDEDQLVGYYTSLEAALNSIYDPDYTIQMLADVELTEGVDISGTVTLDLNGKTISDAEGITTDYLVAVLHGGTLTVEDTASGDGGKISMSKSYCAIKMTKADGDTSKTATLIVNNGHIEGYNYGISGNGNADRVNTSVTINGGTIRATAPEGVNDVAAIYQPQDGVMTLNGGTITGLTGVELRSGSLTIPADSTVSITGTGDPASSASNGNGTTSHGMGIAIAQHTTKKAINVNIAGGNVYGANALAVTNPQNNTDTNVTVAVSGGTFIGTGTNKKALNVTDERVTQFISGGSFSEMVPVALCAAGYSPVTVPDENDLYTVTTGTALYSATLTLAENINVNFYVKSVSSEEAVKYTVSYSFAGQTGTLSLPETPDSQGRYKVVFPEVYSYQMGEVIDITVNYEGQPIKEFTYSASTYFHNMLNKPTTDAATKALCRAALDYGAAAQLYFDGRTYKDGVYNTDSANLVNADTNPNNVVVATQPGSEYAATLNGSIGGISKYTATLLLGSETSIKVFMTGNAANVSVSCVDSKGASRTVTEVVPEGGRYAFQIKGIRAADLDKTYTITISLGGEQVVLTYSPYTYARSKWNNAELGPVVEALVAYGDAARALWPNA